MARPVLTKSPDAKRPLTILPPVLPVAPKTRTRGLGEDMLYGTVALDVPDASVIYVEPKCDADDAPPEEEECPVMSAISDSRNICQPVRQSRPNASQRF